MATVAYILSCDISENNVVILFMFGTVITPCVSDTCKIAFGSDRLPNLSNYGNISHTFYVFVVISWKRKG